MKTTKLIAAIFLLLVVISKAGIASCSQEGKKPNQDSLFIVQNYEKHEYRILMRDGVRLFTSVYMPKDTTHKYPIMLYRTPYSVRPYGENKYKELLGPSGLFTREKFIFVYQDVRGRFMSEGEFVNMRPQIAHKKGNQDIDESSDTYDTIDWLIHNIPNNNGKVGMWGISYPGFYTAVGVVDAHSALVAASPQAPIADWFWDDFHHHGAFFLTPAFNFLAIFGQPRPELTTKWGPRFKHGTPDGYRFFLEEVGPLKNVNEKYFKGNIAFWNKIVEHPNYDQFWQARSLLPHLQNIQPAVMTVGGWFDAEDLFGPLKIYRAIEKNSPGAYNILIMGPWRHGGWARDDGSRLGNVFFGDNPPPSTFYQQNIEFPFFKYYLKGEGALDLPEAYVFETGTNKWRKFDSWPPKNLEQQNLYFHENGKLALTAPSEIGKAYDEFISYPDKPVPYTEAITTRMTREYMTDDQRFAARRPDVLVYQTDVLEQAVTLAGTITANLAVSITGTDADWIVKLIDVYPDDHPGFPHNPKDVKMGGYQQMVRSEVFRGRFRNSYEKPEPFVPNKITEVSFEMQDVLHTFKEDHRIMVQVQSTWFPLVDRNPQKYVDSIFKASAEDFIKATHRVYRSKDHGSYLQVGILK
ncbi:MAG: CocE/NonD family hydrolase [bacterium]